MTPDIMWPLKPGGWSYFGRGQGTMGPLRRASSVPALGEAVTHSYISQGGRKVAGQLRWITVYIQQITALALLCRNGPRPSPSPS